MYSGKALLVFIYAGISASKLKTIISVPEQRRDPLKISAKKPHEDITARFKEKFSGIIENYFEEPEAARLKKTSLFFFKSSIKNLSR